MRLATFATSVWLALLGTLALAQSVTYDDDARRQLLALQDIRVDTRHRGDRRSYAIHIRICCVRAIDRALVAKGLAREELRPPTPTCSSPTTRVLSRAWKLPGGPRGGGPLVSAEAGWRHGEGSAGCGRNACRRHLRRP